MKRRTEIKEEVKAQAKPAVMSFEEYVVEHGINLNNPLEYYYGFREWQAVKNAV